MNSRRSRHIEHDSGKLFFDLRRPEAENRVLKAEIEARIYGIIRTLGNCRGRPSIEAA